MGKAFGIVGEKTELRRHRICLWVFEGCHVAAIEPLNRGGSVASES